MQNTNDSQTFDVPTTVESNSDIISQQTVQPAQVNNNSEIPSEILALTGDAPLPAAQAATDGTIQAEANSQPVSTEDSQSDFMDMFR